jgi:hypothetical protein
MFHAVIRWGLGIHGVIHLAEFFANLYEGAWMSACLTLLSSALMLGGAFIDHTHHRKGEE